MAQLGLGVATDDLVFLGAFEEQLVLLGGSLFTEGDLFGHWRLVWDRLASCY